MGYKRKLIRQAQRLARDAQRAGGVMIVTVYHDSTCSHWRGGPCDCAAVIKRKGGSTRWQHTSHCSRA